MRLTKIEEDEALSSIKQLAKIALRTNDEGQIKISIRQIEQVIRAARLARS